MAFYYPKASENSSDNRRGFGGIDLIREGLLYSHIVLLKDLGYIIDCLFIQKKMVQTFKLNLSNINLLPISIV